MSENLVTRLDVGPVAHLSLNRPEKRNALSQALIVALSDQLDRVGVESAVRAVVLSGSGPAFCSGMDLREAFAPVETEEAERRSVREVQALADLLDQVHKLPKPTIAALNGDALAGGAGLAMACDLVVMSAEARIGYPEVRRGLVPAMVMHDLVRLVGQRRARQLLLSGDAIHAHQAFDWGLVNEVVPPDQLPGRALALGQVCSECAPRALATIKELLDESTQRPRSLRPAAAVTAAIRVSDEAREGIAAFLEKRAPNWSRV